MVVERRFLGRGYPMLHRGARQAQFSQISDCVVRKDHTCGKFVGVSKSCFIACPSTEEVETLLALIVEKLTKIGVEPVIAIKERAYGQDIFCTKICGKIIESQFCIVILDDMIQAMPKGAINIPNSNVYYEYGLMTALGKHVVPLQKQGQQLAFNIQTHDTIKYTPSNVSAELDRAFKDALRAIEERADREHTGAVSPRFIRRCLEMNGFREKDESWFLASDIEDTEFTAYDHGSEKGYLLTTVQEDREEMADCLTDIQVIIKRLESRCSELANQDKELSDKIEKLKAIPEEEQPQYETVVAGSRVMRRRMPMRLADLEIERQKLPPKLESIQNSKFAIILSPNLAGLKTKIVEQYNNMQKDFLNLPLYVGDPSGIRIGERSIVFTYPSL
jgi:hypothetical protein